MAPLIVALVLALFAVMDSPDEIDDGARPLPRAEWLASRRVGEALPALSQMTVHDFGSLAVVSFISSVVSPPPSTSRDVFLVDVWRNEGGQWQLQVRYQAPAAPQPIEPKPTGKE